MQAKRRVYYVQHNNGPKASPKKISGGKRQQGVDLDGEPLQAGGVNTNALVLRHHLAYSQPFIRSALYVQLLHSWPWAAGSAAAASPVVHAVLEPLPKWRLVQDIMQEIQQERIRLASEASTSGKPQKICAASLLLQQV